MPITITCTCGKSLQVADEHAGKQGKCPVCERSFAIPDDSGGEFTTNAPVPRKSDAQEWSNARTDTEPPPEPDDIANLTTHAGVLVTEDDDFFAPAPKEIGRLYSAFTTLKTDLEPQSLPSRLVRVAIVFVIIFVVTAFLLIVMVGEQRNLVGLLCLMPIPVAIGALFGGISFWWTRFGHTCSYVGDKGMAAYRCSGNRENVRETELFLFRDAAELRIGQTRHYYNGVYTGTNYSFTWSDERGATVHALSGRYSSEAGTPAAKDP